MRRRPSQQVSAPESSEEVAEDKAAGFLRCVLCREKCKTTLLVGSAPPAPRVAQFFPVCFRCLSAAASTTLHCDFSTAIHPVFCRIRPPASLIHTRTAPTSHPVPRPTPTGHRASLPLPLVPGLRARRLRHREPAERSAAARRERPRERPAAPPRGFRGGGGRGLAKVVHTGVRAPPAPRMGGWVGALASRVPSMHHPPWWGSSLKERCPAWLYSHFLTPD